jgi:hypothetical protein
VKALELAQLAQAHHPQHGTDRALPHRQEGSCDQHLCVSPHALGKHGLEDQNYLRKLGWQRRHGLLLRLEEIAI